MAEHITAPTWGARLQGLDGVRGVALLCVIAAHVVIVLPEDHDAIPRLLVVLTGLFVHGVTCFFVLSGFLLYRPYVSSILKGRPAPHLGTYLRNRVLRIWPAYLVILAAASIAGVAVVDGSSSLVAGRFGHLTDPGTLIANILLVQNWWPSTAFTGLAVSWSLVTEIGFYAALPALGALGIAVARRRNRVVAALVPAVLLLVVGTTGRITTLGLHDWADIRPTGTWLAVVHRSVLGQGDLFALGMGVAVLVAVVRERPEIARTVRRAIAAAIAVSCVAVLAIGAHDFATIFMGTIFAGGIALLVLPDPGWGSRAGVGFLEWWPIRTLGEYSLSLYLWHFPISWFLRLHVDQVVYRTTADALVSTLMVLVPTVILGTITYRWIEVPAQRLKRPAATSPA